MPLTENDVRRIIREEILKVRAPVLRAAQRKALEETDKRKRKRRWMGPERAAQIRERYLNRSRSGETCLDIALDFDVSPSLVVRIGKGERWGQWEK
jgi:hypothetical protein